MKLDTIRTLLPCVLNDRPELELCDEVRATLAREISGIEERIACPGIQPGCPCRLPPAGHETADPCQRRIVMFRVFGPYGWRVIRS